MSKLKLFSLFIFRMFVTAHIVSILVVLFMIHHDDSLVRYYLRVFKEFFDPHNLTES